ncbi:hypothetical protein, partial [Rhizobium sp.]|uniref:hypothetical protein n=1 Tax=Rhizobium sp. TaxID=391 RepID=UPI0039823379
SVAADFPVRQKRARYWADTRTCRMVNMGLDAAPGSSGPWALCLVVSLYDPLPTKGECREFSSACRIFKTPGVHKWLTQFYSVKNGIRVIMEHENAI